MKIVAEMWGKIQSSLFPYLVECLDDSLTAGLKQFIEALEVVRIEEIVSSPFAQHMGRPQSDRRCLARAFLAKAVMGYSTTLMLREVIYLQPTLRRLCGWERRSDIPSEATFCRAFAEFAKNGVGDMALDRLVATHISDQIVMHVTRDATSVEAREKPAKKPKVRRRIESAHIRKDGSFTPRTRIEHQYFQDPLVALSELPCACDVGIKRNSKGHNNVWIGYKAHIDWTDGFVPINVVTTSASVHDSQVAIPMARITAKKAPVIYELMDSAYDSPFIRKAIEELGHIPIIDRQKNRKDYIPFDPAKKARFAERTCAERGISRLKDEFGLRNVRVRGHQKVHLHVMFGVLALFAAQILRPMPT